MIAQPNKKIILTVNKKLKHDYWKNKKQRYIINLIIGIL